MPVLMLTPISRPAPRRWLRVLSALLLIGGTLTIFYVNAKHPQDLNAFDRTVLTLSAPLQRMATQAFRWADGVWFEYVALVDVGREHTQLRSHVQQMQNRLNQLREVDLENQRLRKLLDFTEQSGRPFRTARVVGYDPTSHYRTLRIDRGLEGGAVKGMAVATAQGVIGRVLRCWSQYSDVLLITDPQSGVDALVQRTRARGTVEGMGSAALRMKYLLRLDEVQEGDLVVTSGFDSVFPGGLLVGTVSNLRKRPSGVFQEVQIVPAVDLSRVEEVVLLESPPPPAAELEGPPRPAEDP